VATAPVVKVLLYPYSNAIDIDEKVLDIRERRSGVKKEEDRVKAEGANQQSLRARRVNNRENQIQGVKLE
jgi:hypothetical protein